MPDGLEPISEHENMRASVSARTLNHSTANRRLLQSLEMYQVGNNSRGQAAGPSSVHLGGSLGLPTVQASVFDGTQTLPGSTSVVLYDYTQLQRRAFSVKDRFFFATDRNDARKKARRYFDYIAEADISRTPIYDQYADQGVGINDHMHFVVGSPVRCPVCERVLLCVRSDNQPHYERLLDDGELEVAWSRDDEHSEHLPVVVSGSANKVCCEVCAQADTERRIEARTSINAMKSYLAILRAVQQEMHRCMQALGAGQGDYQLVLDGKAYQVNSAIESVNDALSFVVWDGDKDARIVLSRLMSQFIGDGAIVSRTNAPC